MQGYLQELIASHLFAFLLIFMRLGMALMIMPGIGDSFVSPKIRLLFALGFSFVLTPVLSPELGQIPENTGLFITLLVSEAFIGIFLGTVMRVLMTALDTAGAIVSLQSGFSNATLFNPSTGSQASLVSAVYSSLGVTLILVSDFHHQMLFSIVESYQAYPASGHFMDTGSAAEVISKAITIAFKIGAQITIPFLVVGTLTQIGFGLLGRLMPQLQVFFLALPIQIFLSLVILSLTISSGILFWLKGYETIMIQSLTAG